MVYKETHQTVEISSPQLVAVFPLAIISYRPSTRIALGNIYVIHLTIARGNAPIVELFVALLLEILENAFLY